MLSVLDCQSYTRKVSVINHTDEAYLYCFLLSMITYQLNYDTSPYKRADLAAVLALSFNRGKKFDVVGRRGDMM